MSSPSKKDLLLVDLKNQVKNHASEIKALHREIDVTKGQLEKCEKELERELNSKTELENRLLEHEARYRELQHKNKILKDESRTLSAQLAETSAEADRLNAELVKGGSISSGDGREDLVRLHDRISQYRKEVEGLRKENETLNNIIKAKDDAIEKSEASLAEASEVSASKRTELNVILDLKRQLKDMEERLGGEEYQNRLADSENEHYREMVKCKDDEIETLLEQIESQRNEVQEARKVRAEADINMAEAAARMAESVEMSERARKAEADRVASGGFVPNDVHEAVLADLEACRQVIRSYDHGNRDGTVLAYKAARATADKRMTQERVQGLKAKIRLAETIGEYEYSLMFNEKPPTEAQLAEVEALLQEALKEEDMLSFQAVVTEKETEVQALRQELSALKDNNERTKAAMVAKEIESQTLQDEIRVLTIKLEETTVAKAENTKVEMVAQLEDTRFETLDPANLTVSQDGARVRGDDRPVLPVSMATPGEQDACGAGICDAMTAVATNKDATNKDDPSHSASKTPMSVIVPRETLASIVRSLVASRESQLQAQNDPAEPEKSRAVHLPYPELTSRDDEDEDLYRNAIALLQEELAKLTDEMMSETDVAAQIRQEVGDWKTAQLSAKQTAELLDSYNRMSMKMAAQAAVMTQRQEAYERAKRNELELMNEISDLRMEIRHIKGKSPLRSVKKAFSSTVKGIKQSIASPAPKTVTTASPLSDAAGITGA